jgi:rhamnulokinase
VSTLNYVAIDLGAESGRAMLGQFDGQHLALTEAHRFPNVPVRLPDGLHWDVLRLWAEIQNGLAAAARKYPVQLSSVGLDTWGVDFGLLDRQGALVGNPYHYRDSRTDGMLDEAFRRMPREQIFEQTGIQFMPINTLYQLLALVAGHSPALELAETCLTIPDLFNFWLSGVKAAEFSIATTTQCYDPRRCTWADPVLAAMGIPRRLFPELISSGTILGPLRAAVAESIGMTALPVIAPACHDTGSAVAAVPAENDNFAWLSSGTWSIFGAEVKQANLTPQALAYNFTNEGGVFGTWRLSKNIMGLWLVQECKREWGLAYDELTRLAAEAQPFLSVIDPDGGVFLHPGHMPEKIRTFCAQSGQAVPQTQGEIVRVALESLALKYRLTLGRLEELTGQRFDVIHIIGGGTRNRLLNQLTADCTGRTVVTGPVEATAIGNILMQAIALGHLSSLTEARRLVRQSFDVETYQPARAAGWDEGFAKLLSFTGSGQA